VLFIEGSLRSMSNILGLWDGFMVHAVRLGCLAQTIDERRCKLES
jgi:hypothetical protein